MDMSLLFRIPVFLVLSQMIYRAETQQCPASGSELSIFGWMLQGHIYKKMMADLGLHCMLVCRRDDRCQSVNFVMSLHMCEFSDRTKEARPEDFIPDPDRYYFRRDINRVPLGSIAELPAETCKEIKASEEGQVVSGKYWLSTIIPDIPVLAYCDMKTEDVDECTASSPVCDLNAKCQNNQGSYYCMCDSGFTGDGKTCQDIDECTQGSHDCLPSLASCTNTVGSYNCSCNPGFVGDGKKSCALTSNGCQNYQSLTDAYRNVNSSNNLNFGCDKGIGPGWFRFQGAAGTRMPTSCPPKYRCNTHAPGWLNGVHPTVASGEVTRKVCFHWEKSCCYRFTNIKVKNCGSFYVYYLDSTPWCSLRYCGTD